MSLNVAIVGAGVGVLTLAIALCASQQNVTVFELAARFARVGADVNPMPNAVHALGHLGIAGVLRKHAASSTHRISRTTAPHLHPQNKRSVRDLRWVHYGIWDTSEETSRNELREAAKEKHDTAQLTIHRADLLKALESALPQECFRMARKATGIVQDTDGAILDFEQGQSATFDLVVGAAGIHSAVRDALFDSESPEFTGLASYRGTFACEKAEGIPDLSCLHQMVGPRTVASDRGVSAERRKGSFCLRHNAAGRLARGRLDIARRRRGTAYSLC